MRLQTLKDLGLVYGWKVIETPGVRRRHSLHLLSTLGARVLADRHRAEPRSYAERARAARDHCWHAIHDLEANQFFISLVIQSRGLSEEGLLAWYGEDYLRAQYRLKAREYKWPAPAPDGGGVYLASGGQIQFDVEWDRATESTARLRQKIASHVGYWEHFRNASHQHLLVVVPTDEREDRLHDAIWRERPHFSSDKCCSFWTTTTHRLRQWGPMGAIWLGVNLRAGKPPRAADTRLRLRTPLSRLAPIRHSDGPVPDLIGKPSWWLRRAGGGQVT